MDTTKLPPELQLAASLLSPKEYQEAARLAREILGLSPRKFALLIIRHIAPFHVLKGPDDALLHGCGVKKLRSLKEQTGAR